MGMELTSEQRYICEYIKKWFRSGDDSFLTVGGYAGTGKTTIISYIAEELRRGVSLKISFCAYTGKATAVLKRKLKEYNKGMVIGEVFNQESENTVSTIHGLMYRPVTSVNKNGKKIIIGWEKFKGLEKKDLIIVDEASMISRSVWNDLRSYGVPILAIGDHGQLPPIGSKFNLMKEPDLRLREVHRNSDPIIKVADSVRKTGHLHVSLPNYDNKNVFGLNWQNQACRDLFLGVKFNEKCICLCGLNSTRVDINTLIRKKLKNTVEGVYPGERVICLKNNHNLGVMNGQIGTALWSLPFAKDLYTMTISMDDDHEDYMYECLVYTKCFGKDRHDDLFNFDHNKYKKHVKKSECSQIDFFDYGYCTTVHKSQGSEWDKVILFVQRNSYQTDDDYKRWLYTAVTRAKEKLFIIYDYS